MRALLTASLATARLLPLTASLAIHVVLVATALVIADATLPRESVFMLELTDLDLPPTPAAPTPATSAPASPPVVRRDPRPPQRPKLKRTPPAAESAMVAQPPTPRVEPPPALDIAPASPPPAPAVALPAPLVAPAPSIPAVPTPAAPAAPAPSPPPPAAPAASVAPTPSSALAGAAPDTGAAAPRRAPADSRSAPSALRASTGGAAAVEALTQRPIPRPAYQYWPDYPTRARQLQIQGTTLLGVFVADDGRVTEVVVKESAGHPDLDEAAAAAVRRWRFEPARRGTQAVAVEVELPFRWRLRQGP